MPCQVVTCDITVMVDFLLSVFFVVCWHHLCPESWFQACSVDTQQWQAFFSCDPQVCQAKDSFDLLLSSTLVTKSPLLPQLPSSSFYCERMALLSSNWKHSTPTITSNIILGISIRNSCRLIVGWNKRRRTKRSKKRHSLKITRDVEGTTSLCLLYRRGSFNSCFKGLAHSPVGTFCNGDSTNDNIHFRLSASDKRTSKGLLRNLPLQECILNYALECQYKFQQIAITIIGFFYPLSTLFGIVICLFDCVHWIKPQRTWRDIRVIW